MCAWRMAYLDSQITSQVVENLGYTDIHICIVCDYIYI